MPRKYKHLKIGPGLIYFQWNKYDVLPSNHTNISQNSAFPMEEHMIQTTLNFFCGYLFHECDLVSFKLSVILHSHSNMINVIFACAGPGDAKSPCALYPGDSWTKTVWCGQKSSGPRVERPLWHFLTTWKWMKPLLSLSFNMLLYKMEGSYACLPCRVVMRIEWDSVREHASKTAPCTQGKRESGFKFYGSLALVWIMRSFINSVLFNG